VHGGGGLLGVAVWVGCGGGASPPFTPRGSSSTGQTLGLALFLAACARRRLTSRAAVVARPNHILLPLGPPQCCPSPSHLLIIAVPRNFSAKRGPAAQVGRALLPLAELARRCPQLLAGEAVRLEVPLRHDSQAAAAAAAGAQAPESAAMKAAEGCEPGAAIAGGAGSGADVAAEPARGAEAAAASLEPGLPPAEATPVPSTATTGPWLSPAGAATAVQGAARRALHAVAAPAAALLGVGSGPATGPASPADTGAFFFSAAPADGGTEPAGTDAEAGGAASSQAAAAATAAGPRLVLTAALEQVDCLEAATAAGLEPAAAQTCLALLAEPGGIYLDVKSAYSTPRDLEVRARRGRHGAGQHDLERAAGWACVFSRPGGAAPAVLAPLTAPLAEAAAACLRPGVLCGQPAAHRLRPLCPACADVCERPQGAGHPHQGGLLLPATPAAGALHACRAPGCLQGAASDGKPGLPPSAWRRGGGVGEVGGAWEGGRGG
jgi:hypothetical protein